MKFSIITPCLNYLKYLPDAVESIYEQAATGGISIEHIVVDAASTDGTAEWLQAYAKKRKERSDASDYSFSFVSEPDNGQADAINKGLGMATGDVVGWLNADEYYLPDALKKLARAFTEHPDADLIHGEALYVNAKKEPLRIKRDHRFDKMILLYYGCYIQSCSTFWRRQVLDDGHYLDDSYKVCMDFEYWVRLMKSGYTLRFTPDVLAAFVWHGENVSEVYAGQRKRERVAVQRKYGFPWINYYLSRVLFQILRIKHAWLIIQRKISNDFRGCDA